AELRGKRQRETAPVRCGEKFFWIRANAVFKTCVERIGRLLEHAAVCGNRPLAGLQVALPNRRCFALHDEILHFKRYVRLNLPIRFEMRRSGYINRAVSTTQDIHTECIRRYDS